MCHGMSGRAQAGRTPSLLGVVHPVLKLGGSVGQAAEGHRLHPPPQHKQASASAELPTELCGTTACCIEGEYKKNETEMHPKREIGHRQRSPIHPQAT